MDGGATIALQGISRLSDLHIGWKGGESVGLLSTGWLTRTIYWPPLVLSFLSRICLPQQCRLFTSLENVIGFQEETAIAGRWMTRIILHDGLKENPDAMSSTVPSRGLQIFWSYTTAKDVQTGLVRRMWWKLKKVRFIFSFAKPVMMKN